MKRASKIIFTPLVAIAFTCPWPAFAQSNRSWTENALHDVLTEAQLEERKAKEMEEKVMLEKERHERRQRDVEVQIANQKFKIEQYKNRHESAKNELESLKLDLSDLESKLQSLQAEKREYEQSTQSTIDYLDGTRKEYAIKQVVMQKESTELAESRKKTEREITDRSIAIERLKADIAKMDARRTEMETRQAELEADEMKVRTEWMAAKMEAAEMAKQRDEAQNRMADAKKRFETARKDLEASRAELAKVAKRRNDLVKIAEADVARYEREIIETNRARIAAESEKVRLDAEVAKVHEYASRIKDNRDQALAEKEATQGLVWKSSLALESARSELSRTVSGTEKAAAIADKAAARNRGIAAAAEAAEMVAGGRLWVSSTGCKAFESPSFSAKPVGQFAEGQKFVAKNAKRGWIQIISPEGNSVFVENHCGNYEN